MSGKFDLAKSAYETARLEILQRMAQRDKALALFLGTAAALFAAALSEKVASKDLALIIPLIGLGVSCLVAQHGFALAALVRYCRYELAPSYALLSDGKVFFWDISESSLGADKANLLLRFWGELLIIFIPSTSAVAINYCLFFSSDYTEIILISFASLSVFLSAVVLWRAKHERKLFLNSKKS